MRAGRAIRAFSFVRPHFVTNEKNMLVTCGMLAAADKCTNERVGSRKKNAFNALKMLSRRNIIAESSYVCTHCQFKGNTPPPKMFCFRPIVAHTHSKLRNVVFLKV